MLNSRENKTPSFMINLEYNTFVLFSLCGVLLWYRKLQSRDQDVVYIMKILAFSG